MRSERRYTSIVTQRLGCSAWQFLLGADSTPSMNPGTFSAARSELQRSTVLFLFNIILLLTQATPSICAILQPNTELYTKPEPTVRVDGGPIIGTITALPAATASVVKFLGVPYAEKARRFQPPERPMLWTKPLRTQRWRPACIEHRPKALRNAKQTHNGAAMNETGNGTVAAWPKESEDCLYLNVYAPATPSQGRGRSVLFWLFGGDFQFGHAGQTAYDGSSFASYQDVIVVTVNYRTNGGFVVCL
jgi:hypothetical protein